MKKLAVLFALLFSSLSFSQGVTAPDCADAINVCTDLDFQINSNQGVQTNEIATLGNVGNPDYSATELPNPWVPGNEGCIRFGESNPTWMRINISGSGSLEFTLGGVDGSGVPTQAGFYDWSLFPAGTSCPSSGTMNVAPIRCNWNGEDFGGTGLAPTGNLPPGGQQTNFVTPLNVTTGDVFLLFFNNFSNASTDVPLQFGGTATVSCTPLPVTLSVFEAKVLERSVVLNWTTVSEIKNDYFILERSEDAHTFHPIAKIDGAGDAIEEINYAFKDESPVKRKTSYYRLKQVDFDGSIRHSKIVAVQFEVESITQIYPNPAENLITVYSSSRKKNSMKFYTPDGGVVKEIQLDLKVSNVVSIEDLNSGVYFVKTIGKDGVPQVTRLLKK